MTRRIVLKHTTGPYAGLSQIHGTDDKMPALPDTIKNVRLLDGRSATAKLSAVHEHYIVYREVEVPPVSPNTPS